MLRLPLALLLSLCLPACGGEEGDDANAGEEASGHALAMNATLVDDEGTMSFISPGGAVITANTADVVGKPYFMATFPAGFSPGNDEALHTTWGTVPESLEMSWTTPAEYADGPYDLVLVIYVVTEVDTAVFEGSATELPPAKAGDLATFTLDQSVVKAGEPAIPPGLVRYNVEGADVALEVHNRTPTDPMDGEQVTAAFANTIMIVP